MIRLGFCVAISVVLVALPDYGVAAPPAHVIIIGVDGMSPDGIRTAQTPNLDRLMREGAYSLRARAVFPTSSSPNWASMIMGAGPEQHGVHSNEWRIDKFLVAPTVRGTDGFFPTMFELLRTQFPDAVSGMFHDWDGFANLFAHSDLSRVVDGDGPEATVDAAIEYLNEANPNLLFVHLDHVDHAGHEFGWDAPEYYQAVAKADALIGRVLTALENSAIAGTTHVIVTADHGGRRKGHGGWSMEEIEIPWMIRGAGIRAGYEIQAPINTYDTAATAMHILGVQPHPAWIAKPVTEAFTR